MIHGIAKTLDPKRYEGLGGGVVVPHMVMGSGLGAIAGVTGERHGAAGEYTATPMAARSAQVEAALSMPKDDPATPRSDQASVSRQQKVLQRLKSLSVRDDKRPSL